jgi:hypothetical protein
LKVLRIIENGSKCTEFDKKTLREENENAGKRKKERRGGKKH